MATQQDLVTKSGLDINGTLIVRSSGVQRGALFNDSSALNLQAGSGSTAGLKIGTTTNTPIIGYTNGLERFRIDATGNLYLGVAPSSWDGGQRAFISGSGAFYGYSTSGSVMVSNAYYNGGWKFLNADWAAEYLQTQGAHQWFTSSASGTGGTGVTFNQAMTLGQNGNLALGLASGNLSGYGVGVRVFTIQGNSLPGAIELALNLATGQNNTLGEINFVNNASTVTSKQSAYITGFQDGTSTTAPGGGIRITTRTDGGGLAERMRIDSNGNVGIGVTPAYRVHAKLDQNGITSNALVNSNGGNAATTQFLAAADTASLAMAIHSSSHATKPSQAWIYNTGAFPVVFGTNSVERMRLDASGNFVYTYGGGAMGYGAGSGGTVTQATSKSTSVSLNKPSGQITLSNAALAANATVAFPLSNSIIAANDTVQVNLKSGYATSTTYQVWAEGISAGACAICVRNISGGSLSEALVLNFTITKGSAA